MALNGLMHMDPEPRLPMLEKILAQDAAKLQERALFVLGQSGSPQAREIVPESPAARATRACSARRSSTSACSAAPRADRRWRRSTAALGSSRQEGDPAQLHGRGGRRRGVLAAAKGENRTPGLRREAIQQLGVMGAQDELWELYRAETRAR